MNDTINYIMNDNPQQHHVEPTLIQQKGSVLNVSCYHVMNVDCLYPALHMTVKILLNSCSNISNSTIAMHLKNNLIIVCNAHFCALPCEIAMNFLMNSFVRYFIMITICGSNSIVCMYKFSLTN